MNKHDLVARIAQQTGATKSSAAAAVDSLLEGITRALKKGEAITFVGFGTFKTTQRRARVAKNPRTGHHNSQASCRTVYRWQGAEIGSPVSLAHRSAEREDAPICYNFPF
jgi:DNA-binding protein HU-beta